MIAVPDEQHARLAEGNSSVVDADELRALRDEQISAGRAVVDVLGHLGGDLAGKSERMPVMSAAGITAPACRT